MDHTMYEGIITSRKGLKTWSINTCLETAKTFKHNRKWYLSDRKCNLFMRTAMNNNWHLLQWVVTMLKQNTFTCCVHVHALQDYTYSKLSVQPDVILAMSTFVEKKLVKITNGWMLNHVNQKVGRLYWMN